jgi:hypothetical protein
VTGLQTALDGKASSSHTHGNITNAGAIGSTADQFVVTTTSGVLTAVSAATARTTLGVQPTASPAFTGTTTVENLTLSGSARRIVADFSSSPQSNRAMFQTSASNASTVVAGIPSGTGTTCVFRAWSASDVTNANNLSMGLFSGTDASIRAESNGTASAIPLTFYTSNTKQLEISSSGTATFAGQILADDIDTANSVAYGFDGDPDTGIGRRGANILTAVTNGVERLRVDASGNVGIGRDSPNVKLEVAGNVGAYGTQPAVHFRVNSNTLRFALFANDADSLHVGRYDSSGGYVDSPLQISRTSGNVVTPAVYSATVGGTHRDVFVDSGGLLGYVSSIRESKTDIVTLDDVSWLSALSPVSYRYRKRNADGTYSDEADGVTDYGLIAEDVEAVRPELCFYDMVDGEPQLRGVTYSKLITPMLKYIQQLEARIAALEERING